MLNDGEKYKYPIDAIRYHFSEFNVWMGFFVVINGGLLVAYRSDGNSDIEKMLIVLIGYIITFLFYFASRTFKRCITTFSNKIDCLDQKTDKSDKTNEQSVSSEESNSQYFRPLKYAKVAITRIVTLLTFILTYPWGILSVLMAFSNIEMLKQCSLPCLGVFKVIIAIALITGINLLFRKIVDRFLLKDIKDHVDV